MNPESATYRRAHAVLRWLSKYHDYQVYGIEKVPLSGPALVVTNHSLATYDAFLLGFRVKEERGRLPHVLADKTFFRLPFLGDAVADLGFVKGSRESALELLRSGAMIGVGPGGMREGLRSSREKYRIDWRDRLGFVWMSMLTGAPIILGAGPSGDDIFDVVPNRFTPWVYEHFRLPLPIFRGRRGLPLPRPVKLWHLLSDPILPPVSGEEIEREDVIRHHKHIVEVMDRLMVESKRLERTRASVAS